ncbi:MAG: acyl-CoA thioesterase [Halodesulfurarchaeum sp.]
MTDFAFEHPITVRYSDLDTLGHVNNARYATFLEEARIAYFEEALGFPLEEWNMVIANLNIDFRAPVRGHAVTVGLEIVRMGNSSFDFEYEIVEDGRTVATASSVQVAYDVDAGEKMSIPEEWREAVEAFEGAAVVE